MVVQSDLNRIKALLTEAVTVLCKNALSFGTELSIEGLLGITLDKQDVFLVSIHETSRKNFASPNQVESTTMNALKEASQRLETSNEEHSSKENSKPEDILKSNLSLKVKQECQPVVIDIDAPQDLSRAKRTFDREWSPIRKRRKSTDTLYDTTCEALSCSSDTSMNPLDLIIKHERISESECERMKNNISRQFNISHPPGSIQNCSIASSKEDPPDSEIHIEKNSPEDNNSEFNNSDTSLSSSGWGQESSPFCLPRNILPVSNQTPFSSAIGTTPSVSQIPMLGTAIFQQFNLGTSVSLMKNHMPMSFSRRSSLSGRTFTCHICSKIVRTNQALRDHIATHEQTKRYRCPHCDQQFVHRSSLANHKRKCLVAMQQDFYDYTQSEKT